jgi:hypothetical protein
LGTCRYTASGEEHVLVTSPVARPDRSVHLDDIAGIAAPTSA